MLTYMLDTDICIMLTKNYPADLRENFHPLADQLCMSSITLASCTMAWKSWRASENLTAIEHFVARLDVLPLGNKARMVRFGPSWSGRECPAVRTTCRSAVMPAVKG